MSEPTPPPPESPGLLVRYFWRDPDPLWRWASGQHARRWWRHPMIGPAVFMLCVGVFLAVVLAFVLRFSFAGQGRGPSIGDIASIAQFILYICATAAFMLLFLHVAAKPFDLLSRLGGPSMLRQVSLTPVPRAELGRILFWGSYRWVALPALIVLYGFEIPLALAGAMGLGNPGRVMGFSGLLSGPIQLVSVFFLYGIKPVFDHMMNLAISWRIYLATGRRGYGMLLALGAVVLGFPLLRMLLNLLLMAGVGLLFSGSILNSAISPGSGGGPPAFSGTLPYAFQFVSFVSLALTLGLKAWIARACYKEFLVKWPDWIEERFGERV